VEKLMTPAEVAEILSVTERSVKNWLRGGSLHGIKVGKSWRVEKSAVEQFVINGRVLT
jgi:acetyl-CoA synthetase